jgi:hypothetical protein
MINILNSINELHDLCLARAEANLPFSSGQDYEIVDENKQIYVGNVFDAAFAGEISCSVCKSVAQAHDVAHAFKLLFCLSPYEYDILGPRYKDYCMALCYYLARIDYECFKSKFYGDIDYDFYEICVNDGIKYNRLYFMYIFDASIGVYQLGQCRDLCQSYVSKLISSAEKTNRSLKDALLLINRNVVLKDPDYCCSDTDLALLKSFEQLMTDKVFVEEVMPKLPSWIQEALIMRDGSKLNKTIFAFYIQAINDQYQKNLSVKITDKLFDNAFGQLPGTFCKYRNRKRKEMQWSDDSELLKISEKFPKFKLKKSEKK